MGTLTDFCVASFDELQQVFPQRVAVKAEPVVKTVANPFTGAPTTIQEWLPANPIPMISDSELEEVRQAERNAFRTLPHFESKSIDPVQLACLAKVLGGGEVPDYVPELSRPALVAGDDFDDSIVQLPDKLVTALSQLSGPAIIETAIEWSSVEGSQFDGWKLEDAQQVLDDLRALAKIAASSQKHLYLWFGP